MTTKIKLTKLQTEAMIAVANGEVKRCREMPPFQRGTVYVWRHKTIRPQVFTALEDKELIRTVKRKFTDPFSSKSLGEFTEIGRELYNTIKIN